MKTKAEVEKALKTINKRVGFCHHKDIEYIEGQKKVLEWMLQ